MTNGLGFEHPAFEQVIRVAGLIEMMRYRRPAWSTTEKKFLNRFIVPTGAQRDGFGNYILRIGDAPVLWSCHTDTVHATPGHQLLSISPTIIALSPRADSNCLGADCTTGVWIMLQMIRAKVPGLYVFHREEERGAKGSKWIAKENPKQLEGIKFAIAFDRRGKESVITRQFGGKCASKAFVESIVPMLPQGFKGDDTGVYTDTASYIDIIPECTNLSVGYFCEHSKNEIQNVPHIIALRDAMVKFDHTKLVAARDPKVRDYSGYTYHYNDHGARGVVTYRGMRKGRDVTILHDDFNLGTEEYMARRDLRKLIEDYPYEVGDFLEEQGYDHKSLWEVIQDRLPGYRK